MTAYIPEKRIDKTVPIPNEAQRLTDSQRKRMERLREERKRREAEEKPGE